MDPGAFGVKKMSLDIKPTEITDIGDFYPERNFTMHDAITADQLLPVMG